MRTTSGSGQSFLPQGDWVANWERTKREAVARLREQVDHYQGNVVGGSLDGAKMPEGTKDGQQYRWDASLRRWISVR